MRRDDYDTTVSRSYYAVLHALKALTLTAEQARTHNGTIQSIALTSELASTGVLRDARSVIASVQRLYTWRQEADYSASVMEVGRATDAMAFAERLVAVVEEVLK